MDRSPPAAEFQIRGLRLPKNTRSDSPLDFQVLRIDSLLPAGSLNICDFLISARVASLIDTRMRGHCANAMYSGLRHGHESPDLLHLKDQGVGWDIDPRAFFNNALNGHQEGKGDCRSRP